MKKAVKRVVKPKKEAPRLDINDEKKKDDTYTASVKVFGKTYVAKGATLEEALANVQPDQLVRGMSVITIQHDDQVQERILPRLLTARLFAQSAAMRNVALKNVAERFTV